MRLQRKIWIKSKTETFKEAEEERRVVIWLSCIVA